MRRSDPYNDSWGATGRRSSLVHDDYRSRPAYDGEFTSDPHPSGGDDRNWAYHDAAAGDDGTLTSSGPTNLFVSFLSIPSTILKSLTNFFLSGDIPNRRLNPWRVLFLLIVLIAIISGFVPNLLSSSDDGEIQRPMFVYEHPYVSSSYYSSTKSLKTLLDTDRIQVQPKKEQLAGKKVSGEKDFTRETTTRLAIVRPFCEFDAEALPTTFACWEALPPCRAAAYELGDEELDEEFWGMNKTDRYFDDVGSHMLRDAKADLFLFYSQTFSENMVAVTAVDAIIDKFNEPGGWSQCIDSIYAIEANIPQELDLYIPSAQEELYNWVNGPNRQYEAAFRIIQSGEWGEYDGFYLMEGDSIPIKSYWLDTVLSEIEVHRPFAIMGAKYNGDKWDQFYEQIPISLIDHTNGNAIYNTSHPLLERLVGQLEVEAPCPYNSIPYDYRMSQMWIEGTMGIVPKLSPQIMLNEEGENITLSNNTAMFKKWGDMWKDEHPFKETDVIHNYAATNLIPRHLGPEYIIHGAKLYSPWDPTRTEITLVVMEWFFDRSEHLLRHLDEKDHPFSEVIIMLPPNVEARDDYNNLTVVPTRPQHRGAPDYMDLCEAEVTTDWFMLTNSYHSVANHVDMMFTPGKYQPVIPFTPATFPFCFKFPYCKESVTLAQRFNPGHDKVVLDFDMLYHTETRNKFCDEWKAMNGDEGENLYAYQKNRVLRRKKIIGPPGPTGTSYTAFLFKEKKDGMYKLTDRSLYGARAPFIKIFAKEEKLDGMSEEELAKKVGSMGQENVTDCNCFAFETMDSCEGSPMGCVWRPLFESCRPPEMLDDGVPICPETTAPTFSPTEPFDGPWVDTEKPAVAPTKAPVKPDPWYATLFKAREHDTNLEVDEAEDFYEDDDFMEEIETIAPATGPATLSPTVAQLKDVTQESDGDMVVTDTNRKLLAVDEVRNVKTHHYSHRRLEELFSSPLPGPYPETKLPSQVELFLTEQPFQHAVADRTSIIDYNNSYEEDDKQSFNQNK